MARLQDQVRRLLAPSVRKKLLPRGLARVLIWREGRLPPNSPDFAFDLSYDLLEYGYTLLRLALQLRESAQDTDLGIDAFGRAAEAIETVVRRGDPNDAARGFHTIVAACSYHLGKFSARAFSLSMHAEGLNLNVPEEVLRLLMRRSLNPLADVSLEWLRNPENTDQAWSNRMKESPGDVDIEDVLRLSITSAFLRAILTFDFALLTGQAKFAGEAAALLSECEAAAAEARIVTLWWICRLAKTLIADLWTSSLHIQIPQSGAGVPAEWAGLRSRFIAFLRSRRIAEIELWPSQLTAASRVMQTDDDLVVSLPTSAGKTRIAEMCILRTLSEGRRVVYVTPLRALSAQAERDLRDVFQSLGYSVSSLYGAIGEVGVDGDTLANRDIVIATPEKLDFALRQDPALLDDVGLVVLDEAHMIGADEREVRYEIFVQRLLRRQDAHSRRLVCLSAILPKGQQLEDYVSWIRQGAEGEPVLSDWRPTRQRFGTLSWSLAPALKPYRGYGRLDFIVEGEAAFLPRYLSEVQPSGRRRKGFPSDAQELTLAAAWKVVAEGGSALVFCPQKRSVAALAKTALKLASQGLLSSVRVGDGVELERAKNVGAEWLGRLDPAVQCLDLGIAVHHADLPKPFLREVEALLRAKKLKVTISSPTLAQGLNLSASTLVMNSLRRGKELITGEEFANVIGRAGRAGVDIDGQILYVMFEPEPWKRTEWEKLINAAKHRQIQSGLSELVGLIADRMARALSVPFSQVLDEIANNTDIWDRVSEAPVNASDEEEIPSRPLEEMFASLDTAILALVEDHEASVSELAHLLDNILTDSLWVRTLSLLPDSLAASRRLILEKRAEHIWNSTTATQRKGYFAAGVGLKAGLKLDGVAEDLCKILFQAETAIASGNAKLAGDFVISFAETVLEIPPFQPPKKLPVGWPEMIRLWIMGTPLSEIAELSDEAVSFVEQVVVYRLVWAVEALRVRGKAHSDLYSDLISGRVSEVLEVGTLNKSAAVLLQAGLGSRVAAHAALAECGGDFTDYEGMRDWLDSDVIKRCSPRSNFPTRNTKDAWRDFVRANSREFRAEWQMSSAMRNVAWLEPSLRPPDGQYVRLDWPIAGPRTDVCDPDYGIIGRLSLSLKKPMGGGACFGIVGAGGTTLTVHYTGPDTIV